MTSSSEPAVQLRSTSDVESKVCPLACSESIVCCWFDDRCKASADGDSGALSLVAVSPIVRLAYSIACTTTCIREPGVSGLDGRSNQRRHAYQACKARPDMVKPVCGSPKSYLPWHGNGPQLIWQERKTHRWNNDADRPTRLTIRISHKAC